MMNQRRTRRSVPHRPAAKGTTPVSPHTRHHRPAGHIPDHPNRRNNDGDPSWQDISTQARAIFNLGCAWLHEYIGPHMLVKLLVSLAVVAIASGACSLVWR